MRFLLTVMGDAAYESGKPPSAEMLERMGAFMDQGIRSGVIKDAGGLKPSADGVKLRARDGRIAVIDGPFTESKEIIGGYAFIEAPSKADAISIAARFIEVHFAADVMNVDVELREVVGGPDTA
jgi:hypothetical protein